MRHIDIKYWAVQEKVESDEVDIDKIPGQLNPADLGTKAVTSDVLRTLMSKAGLENLPGTMVAEVKMEKRSSQASWRQCLVRS